MPLQTITGGGSFTRNNINQINSNFAAIDNPDLWVRPQSTNPNSAADGTYDKPFASVTASSPYLRPGMSVGVLGVLQEEYSGPIINDVTIVGMGNQPRQATTSGVANGGGATWLSPSGGTGALLTVNGQSWKVQNIFFNNSATAAACIKLASIGDPPTQPDSGHTQILGCVLTGTDDGIQSGGANFVTIDGCMFFGFSGSGDLAITSGSGGGGTALYNTIKNCEFLGNDGHITLALQSSEIAYNHFGYISNGKTATTQIVLTGGANNSIHDNQFDVPFNVAGLTAMFATGTNDRWAANSMGTAVLTPMTGKLWGIPVSGAA